MSSNILFMVLWKVSGAPFRPKRMCVHSEWPFGVLNASNHLGGLNLRKPCFLFLSILASPGGLVSGNGHLLWLHLLTENLWRDITYRPSWARKIKKSSMESSIPEWLLGLTCLLLIPPLVASDYGVTCAFKYTEFVPGFSFKWCSAQCVTPKGSPGRAIAGVCISRSCKRVVAE